MNAALEGGEWSAARPGRTLPPGKDPVPIVQEAGWAPGPPRTCCTHKMLRAYVRVHRAWFRMATKEMQISENAPHEYQQIHNNRNTGRFIMYSWITKMYYRKTVGHVFTKPVQIERTTQIPPPPPPVSCFSS